MISLKELMKDYLEDSSGLSSKSLNEIAVWLPPAEGDCPVVPSEGPWETISDPTRYQKKFQFSDQQSLVGFINEVLAYQNHNQHHGKITIDSDSVMIEVYTHDVNTITELDQEYIHEVDNIFLDVQYSNSIKNEEF